MVVLYQLLFAAAVVLGQVTVNNNQTFHSAAPSSAAVIQAKGCVNSKRGLAWPPRNSQHGTPMTSFPAGVISSYFTWGVTPVLNASYPFIPMLWGCDAASVRNFSAAVDANFAVNGYTPHLTKDKAILAFSEPQLASQANCTPEVAVGVWIKYIEPLKKKGYRLGSPAVSVSEKGNAWLLEFMLQCGKKCTPDFLALHWYGTNYSDIETNLRGYHDVFKLPIWLTEFAAQNFTSDEHTEYGSIQPTMSEVTSILNQGLAFMDKESWIERYFGYGAMTDTRGLNPNNALLRDDHGALTSLGQVYVANMTNSTSVNYCAVRNDDRERVSRSVAVALVLAVVSLLAT